MIYLDSSVALARLFDESRSPAIAFWAQPLTSSKLLEYEIWNRIHAYGLTDSHREAARALLMRIILVEMGERVLARALEPLPSRVRTLDALHLATVVFIQARGQSVALASYDNRLIAAAQAMAIPIAAV